MDEKIVALLVDYFNYHGFSVLLVIPFIVGFVSLFISGRRVRGFLMMICSTLYSCAYFGLVYSYIALKETILFAAIIVPLEVFGWVKFHHFSAKKCFITLIFFPLVIVGFLVAIPLIEQQEALLFIKALTTTEWSYMIFFACLGVWIMPYILKFFALIFELADDCRPYSSNQDGVDGATGNERSVDTVSMSDSSSDSDY